MHNIVVALGVLVVTFLLGSIPWGLIISKVFFHTDIRQHGSGNIGTTNAMRTMGKKGGAAVFLLDFGKGLLSGAVALAAANLFLVTGGSEAPLVTRSLLMALATMGCTLGHIFSPWLNFKGGKGIAVAVGALFITFGPAGACFELFVVFAVLVIMTRMVSVGSIAAAAVCPFVAACLYPGEWLVIGIFALTGAVVVWAHRGNIKRILSGTERKIGSKKKEA